MDQASGAAYGLIVVAVGLGVIILAILGILMPVFVARAAHHAKRTADAVEAMLREMRRSQTL